MVILKTRPEIDTMREAGRIVASALNAASAAVRPGVRLTEINEAAETTIQEAGGRPSFLGYRPHFATTPFPATLRLSPNDVIVHGIPDQRRLREGDILSIDCGAILNGSHGEAAVTVPVGSIDHAARRLLGTTERALHAGINQVHAHNRLSDVSHAVGRVAREAGCGVVGDLGVHGAGRTLHENPPVLNDGPPGRGRRLKEGLVLAIEPIFNEGAGDYVLRKDGWTLATADGSRSAHFEHTVAFTDEGYEVLTLP